MKISLADRRQSVAEVEGTGIGPFLVHEAVAGDQHYAATAYAVTHRNSGLRFPWLFLVESRARDFAEAILPLLPWGSFDGEPQATAAEKAAIREIALAHGGLPAGGPQLEGARG